jgi:proline dehydrogenase
MFNRVVAWMLPAVPQRIVGSVARRYIAGEDRESALELVDTLKDQGFETTLDILGEDITELAQAKLVAERYVELVRAVHDRFGGGHVSLKLTQFGLRLDAEACFAGLSAVLEAARVANVFVRVDMEDARVTDVTLGLYRRARARYERVGTVLQACLKRTPEDARRLAAEGASIRLCKGIYREAREISWRSRKRVRESYLETARILFEGTGHVALATHDKKLIAGLEALVAETGVDRERVEFQALLGVPIRSTLERLRDQGYRIRLYVPFGNEWYAYSVRRLQENPKMAGQIVTGLFRGDRVRTKKLAEAR